ncbi:hypothetical protein DFJ77DRAFT_264647 [Powellomyces hirtus]|nr:hypothetical protein DFJ77DRAFT_264647 [Powellomyces hirtus]
MATLPQQQPPNGDRFHPLSVITDGARSRRLLCTHQRFLRALANAIVRTQQLPQNQSYTASTSTSASSPQHTAIAVTHRAFVRTIATGTAATRDYVARTAPPQFAAFTAGDLARLMRGEDDLTSLQRGRKGRMNTSRSTSADFDRIWAAFDRAIRAVVAVAKDVLANPWVDLSLLAAALTAVSWFYIRRLGHIRRGRNGLTPDGHDVSSKPLPSTPPEEVGVSHREVLLADLSARAERLASALERSILQAAQLDGTVAAQEAMIQKLEEENRILVMRLERALQMSSCSPLDTSDTSCPERSTSATPGEDTPELPSSPAGADSEDWDHLTDMLVSSLPEY